MLSLRWCPCPENLPCAPAVRCVRCPLLTQWVAVNIKAGATAGTVVADLSTLNGSTAYAIRYAWTGDCCSNNP